MSVRVLLPNAFQKHTNGAREIQSSAGNLPQLITEMETTFPALRTHLRDDFGQVRKFINFYVNEEDIRFLGNEKYTFQDGDEVLVIPSIAGGSCACCSYCGQEECNCCEQIIGMTSGSRELSIASGAWSIPFEGEDKLLR